MTWGGVKPGDQLVFGDSSAFTDGERHVQPAARHRRDGMVGSYNVLLPCENNKITFSTPTGTAVTRRMQPASLANCGATADIMDVALRRR